MLLYPALSIQAQANPVTLTANVFNDGNKITGPVVEWTVISGTIKTNYTGENLTLTKEQEGKLTIIMRARSAITSDDDSSAWAIYKSTFAY